MAGRSRGAPSARPSATARSPSLGRQTSARAHASAAIWRCPPSTAQPSATAPSALAGSEVRGHARFAREGAEDGVRVETVLRLRDDRSLEGREEGEEVASEQRLASEREAFEDDRGHESELDEPDDRGLRGRA